MWPTLCNSREICHEQARLWLLRAWGAEEPAWPDEFMEACGMYASSRRACEVMAQAWLKRLDWLTANPPAPVQKQLF